MSNQDKLKKLNIEYITEDLKGKMWDPTIIDNVKTKEDISDILKKLSDIEEPVVIAMNWAILATKVQELDDTELTKFFNDNQKLIFNE